MGVSKQPAPIRVLHVVASLRGYGAERVVMDLLPALQSPMLHAGALTVYASQVPQDETAALPFDLLECGRTSRRDYFFLHRLVEAIRSFRPDVVHTHTHVGKYWGVTAAALAGVRRIVYTEHNPCDPRRGRLERLMDLPVNRALKRVVTFFPEQRALLSTRDRIPLNKIVTIPNGLPCVDSAERQAAARKAARAELHIKEGDIALLLVGRLEYQKNQQLAMRAIAASDAASRRRLCLYLAGTGTNEDRLRALAKELGIAESVFFLGYRTDLPFLLQGADMLLMTSLFEGMPLAVIEAMRAGVPVVSTPWIGAGQMLGNGRYGILTPGWSAENVLEAVGHACGPTSTKMAERARQYVSDEYALHRMSTAHTALYEDLCLTA